MAKLIALFVMLSSAVVMASGNGDFDRGPDRVKAASIEKQIVQIEIQLENLRSEYQALPRDRSGAVTASDEAETLLNNMSSLRHQKRGLEAQQAAALTPIFGH